jgi:hypothetical protein
MTLRILPLALCLCALAPSANAFAAMDCVGSDVCTSDRCTPLMQVFTISFDWTAPSATVELNDRTIRLDMAGTDDDTFPGTAGALTYTNADDAGLILNFDMHDITMTLFPGDGTRHIAACSAREAA